MWYFITIIGKNCQYSSLLSILLPIIGDALMTESYIKYLRFNNPSAWENGEPQRKMNSYDLRSLPEYVLNVF